MMKMCILCSNSFASGVRIFSKQAVSFTSQGCSVTIIGRLRGEHCMELIRQKGLSVISLPAKNSFFQRFWRNLLLFVNGISCRADIWYCHELDSLIVGILLKFFIGGKVIFDCHEYFPEKKYYKYKQISHTIGKIAEKVIELLFERFIYKGTNAIVAVNEHMAKRLKIRTCRPVFILPNYPHKDFLKQKPLKKYSLPKHTMIYIGGLNEQRNIHGLVKVLALVREKYCIDATLAILGSGSETYLRQIKHKIQELGLSKHVFLNCVPDTDIPYLLKQAEIGMFLLTADDPSHQWGEPIKFFEYSAAGLPVVMSDLSAKKRLVDKFNNGFVVNPLDENTAAKYCSLLFNDEELRKRLGNNGKDAFEDKYNWESLEEEIHSLFTTVAPESYSSK